MEYEWDIYMLTIAEKESERHLSTLKEVNMQMLAYGNSSNSCDNGSERLGMWQWDKWYFELPEWWGEPFGKEWLQGGLELLWILVTISHGETYHPVLPWLQVTRAEPQTPKPKAIDIEKPGETKCWTNSYDVGECYPTLPYYVIVEGTGTRGAVLGLAPQPDQTKRNKERLRNWWRADFLGRKQMWSWRWKNGWWCWWWCRQGGCGTELHSGGVHGEAWVYVGGGIIYFGNNPLESPEQNCAR